MKVEIDILQVGYSNIISKANMKANCTCSLIRDGKHIIIVDTLTAWDAEVLIEALKSRGLVTRDVTHVVCTHGHSDHVGNLNLFTSAVHIVGQSISQGDMYTVHSFEENSYNISDYIEVIATPGHTLSDVSIIAKETAFGTTAVVGDLFEKEEDIKCPEIWKDIAGSENPVLQYKNRQKILMLADFIIPGHGPGFPVTNEMRKCHENQFQ